MEKKSIVTLAVVVIFAFVLGTLSGIFYQKQKAAPAIQGMQSLSSKVVNAIVTYGTVNSIDNSRNITLSYNGDSMTISILTDAKVYIYENSTRREISFNDVQVGDVVNITASLDASGKPQGNMIVIFARNSQ